MSDNAKTNGDGKTNGDASPTGSAADGGDFEVKVGFARMLQGGVIMDVTTAEEARIAEDAGAVAVMALERVPSDIRKEGGVARMADIERITSIQEVTTIPTMAKVRIGHFQEARVLEQLAVDFIDESEVLTPADNEHHIDKTMFRVPFVCGARNLGEALRRIAEGAALIRTKGEAGTGDVSEAVRHLRLIRRDLAALRGCGREELMAFSKNLGAPFGLVKQVWEEGRLPVPNFAAGGVATPADAALVMSLGAESVFVGSGIFKSDDPAKTAAAIVKATARFQEAGIVVEACREAGGAMKGMAVDQVPAEAQLQTRGW